MFVLALTVSDILFQMFNLEKVGQGHGAQLSQWCHSTATINIYINLRMFCTSSHHFRYIT